MMMAQLGLTSRASRKLQAVLLDLASLPEDEQDDAAEELRATVAARLQRLRVEELLAALPHW
jgi:hypothetical protein